MSIRNNHKHLETPLYQACDIRALEAQLFAQTDSYQVMQNAAQSVYRAILSDFPTPQPEQTVHVLLGMGNNAGDGLLIAVLLQRAGFRVRTYRLFHHDFHGDAHKAWAQAQHDAIHIVNLGDDMGNMTDAQDISSRFALNENDIVVEALFGIGLNRPIAGIAHEVIMHINHYKSRHPSLRIYAVDIPAGILTDTGKCANIAMRADKTVTFLGDKIGLWTSDGKACAGEVITETLGCHPPPSLINRYRYDMNDTGRADKQRNVSNTHKGDYGHALIVGSGQGMFGAGALASVSALKVGAGKSSLYSHPDYATQFHLEQTPLYEVMRAKALDDFSAYSAVVLGVGLGRDEWGRDVFLQTLASCRQSAIPLLIDADGLWHLADKADKHEHNDASCISIITPHEAEASRLLGCSLTQVCENKPDTVRALAKKYRCIAVLKGAGTLISDGQRVWINETGNACLATAGSGDVLAGMIGGYLAQGFDVLEATLYGVFRHGLAADKYADLHAEKSLRASDLWLYL